MVENLIFKINRQNKYCLSTFVTTLFLIIKYMKKIISISLTFFLPFILIVNCKGQNNTVKKEFDFLVYRKYINEAEYSFSVTKDYNKTIKLYDNAQQYVSEKNRDYYYLIQKAICYLNLKDTLKAINSLTYAVTKGYLIINEMGWLQKLFQPKDWEKVLLTYSDAKKKYYSTIEDFDLFIHLKNLEDRDQNIRKLYSEVLPNPIFNRVLEINDSANFDEIINLLKEKRLDHIGTSVAIELYHVYGKNKKYFAFFDSVLQADVFNGSYNPHAYVQWYDRQRIYVDGLKTQLYGEWNEWGSGEFAPIEDIQNVDKRRAELGLCTLEKYAQIQHLKLPSNYLITNK